MVAVNVKIIEELKSFLALILSDSELKEVCFERKEDFSRKRKLGFPETIYLMINMIKRSLKVEIQDFLEYGLGHKISYTKMAFVLQRKKIKSVVFEVWNQLLTNCFYHYYEGSAKKWNDFLLVAVDGTTAYLPDKPEVRDYFGVQKNQYVEVPMARIMKFYDVLNHITIFSKIVPITVGEQSIVSSFVEQLPINSISIYDRGFPSYLVMYLLNNQESMRHFVMRCKADFNLKVKEFVASNQKDIVVNLFPTKDAIKKLHNYGYSVTKDTPIRIRMVKVILDTGETEVLLTNLYNEDIFKTSCFKKLYFKRWGVETSIGFDKNTMQIEEFSGQSVKSIEQDFYISIFVLNLQSLLEKQCQSEMEQKNIERKLNYKINKNVSIGSMKHRIVKLFTVENPEIILMELQNLFLESLEPIRPGRSAPRVFKTIKRRGKFKTLTNYKRAI
jgi:hypothetical protein